MQSKRQPNSLGMLITVQYTYKKYGNQIFMYIITHQNVQD